MIRNDDLRGIRMILVEDDTLLKDSLSLFFRSRGCDLVAFETAEDALEEMKKGRFGVIISDHWLPGMNGLSLLNRAREIDPGVIRILFTGNLTPGIFEEAKRSGVDDLILKPFTPDEIEASILRLIRERDTETADAP